MGQPSQPINLIYRPIKVKHHIGSLVYTYLHYQGYKSNVTSLKQVIL